MIRDEEIDDQVLQKIMDARGYLVLCGYRSYTIGQILPCFGTASRDLNSKARVIALTDVSDFIEQARIGDYSPGDNIDHESFNYCRILVE